MTAVPGRRWRARSRAGPARCRNSRCARTVRSGAGAPTIPAGRPRRSPRSPVPLGGTSGSIPSLMCSLPRWSRSGQAADPVEMLEQVVRGQLDLLVPPFRRPVDAGDQSGAVHPPEVAAHEGVAGLGLVGRRPRSARGATRRTRPRSAARGRRSRSSASGWTSPQSLSRTYCRASISFVACSTPAGFTVYDAMGASLPRGP